MSLCVIVRLYVNFLCVVFVVFEYWCSGVVLYVLVFVVLCRNCVVVLFVGVVIVM